MTNVKTGHPRSRSPAYNGLVSDTNPVSNRVKKVHVNYNL